MAVFTPVTLDQASAWFTNYNLGNVQDVQGISSGIENSNFFVTLDSTRYVLTLFERLQAGQLPFYLGLMKHLAIHGVNCPNPLPNRQGNLLGAGPDDDRGERGGQAEGRPVRREHPRESQAGAVQGQRRTLRRRSRPPQGRQVLRCGQVGEK